MGKIDINTKNLKQTLKVIIIIIIQIFTEEGLSHSRVLFMRVLYLTKKIILIKTKKFLKNIVLP